MKRIGVCVSTLDNDGFPRSTERGLIEALAIGASDGTNNVCFPRSTERGLIEAKQFSIPSVDLWGNFPRSTERGLIEAMPLILQDERGYRLSAFNRARPH